MGSVTSAPTADTWSAVAGDVYEAAALLDLALGPAAIRGFHDAVVRAGERHDVFVVDRVPRLAYRRDRDGPVLDHLRRDPGAVAAIRDLSRVDRDRRLPDGFLLGVDEPEYVEPVTRLAYVDRAGRWRDEYVRDIADAAEAAGVAWAHRGPPVRVSAICPPAADHVEVACWLASDIWFPWTFPYEGDGAAYRDNRALARLNGGRFNDFLTDVRAACAAAGGRFEAYVRAGTDADGFIDLDAGRPAP